VITKFIKKYCKELLIGAVFVLAYVPTIIWMWDRWFARDSYYTHGILIPFVTIFFIWQKKDELALIEKAKSVWGLPLVVIGMMMHLFASLMRVYFISGFSMLVVLVGLILFFYGEKVFRKIIFPILFLTFMIPVPLVVITNISFKMKIFAAKIATMILNNSGIPAIREGSLIRMRHAQVVVDDVCSGLRSLISLMALGSIFAYWMKSTMTKRTVLFLTTIPIAIITNVFRVVFLSSVAEIWGVEYAGGWMHDVTGYLIFGFAFLLFYGVWRILE